jgi:hypothetical protein
MSKWEKEFERRWKIFLGHNVPPFFIFCRVCWFAFACWTMAAGPGEEHSITPAVWVLIVAMYYFYL